MHQEPTNADRAEWGKDSLAIFTAQTFAGSHPDTMNRDDLVCAISDLIADLLHFAKSHQFDTDTIMQRAYDHFSSERMQEFKP